MKRKVNIHPFCLLPFAFCLLISACGSLYKVKPPVSAPLPDDAKASSARGIELRAVPMFTDEESQDLFEANLPLAGLLPVRIEIENKGDTVFDLKKAKFHLRDAAGKEWKHLSIKDTVKRVLKANDVFAYRPASRKEFLDGLNAHALQVGTPLAQGEKRQGLLFFQTPDKGAVERQQGLSLTVEKLSEKVELRLN